MGEYPLFSSVDFITDGSVGSIPVDLWFSVR